jgi:phosphatidylglycerophosphate synthase
MWARHYGQHNNLDDEDLIRLNVSVHQDRPEKRYRRRVPSLVVFALLVVLEMTCVAATFALVIDVSSSWSLAGRPGLLIGVLVAVAGYPTAVLFARQYAQYKDRQEFSNSQLRELDWQLLVVFAASGGVMLVIWDWLHASNASVVPGVGVSLLPVMLFVLVLAATDVILKTVLFNPFADDMAALEFAQRERAAQVRGRLENAGEPTDGREVFTACDRQDPSFPHGVRWTMWARKHKSQNKDPDDGELLRRIRKALVIPDHAVTFEMVKRRAETITNKPDLLRRRMRRWLTLGRDEAGTQGRGATVAAKASPNRLLRLVARRGDRQALEARIDGLLEPIGRRALELGFRPYLTIAATATLATTTTVLVSIGRLRLAGIVFAVGCLFEILDGKLASMSKDSHRATYVDQVVDRLVDGGVLGAIVFFAFVHRDGLLMVLALVTLVAGLTASFERAEAEALHLRRGDAGFGRILRLILLVPALTTPWLLQFMTVIAGVSVLSLLWRFVEVAGVWRLEEEVGRYDQRWEPVFPPRLGPFPSGNAPHEAPATQQDDTRRIRRNGHV